MLKLKSHLPSAVCRLYYWEQKIVSNSDILFLADRNKEYNRYKSKQIS